MKLEHLLSKMMPIKVNSIAKKKKTGEKIFYSSVRDYLVNVLFSQNNNLTFCEPD